MEKVYNWYAVYTRPRWEKKAADLIRRQNIDAYCPLNKVMRQWSDRKKIILEPLFKSYIFVLIADEDRYKVLEIPGILKFVSFLGKPAVIGTNEIEMIKRFLNEHQTVRLEKYDIRVNDKVLIRSGPFGYQKADVIEVRHKVIKVILPSLGYRMIAEINKSNIELLKEDCDVMSAS